MAARQVSGVAVAYTGAGFVLLWSGIKNTTLKDTLTSLLKGRSPAAVPGTPPTIGVGPGSSSAPGSPGSAPGDTGAHSQSASQNQNIAKLSVAISHPTWASGQEWADWVSLWNRESGWNNLAQNPGSGAFGIAQALGHGVSGTSGKYGNQYPSKAANDGSALAQIQWGISYIAQRYGSPSAAWAHEQANGWY